MHDAALALAADRLDPPEGVWTPLPHQRPPETWGKSQYMWLLLGGRGIGKTDGGAHTLDRFMCEHPGTRGRIIAPTLGDAREACVEGVSGLKAHNPTVRFVWSTGTVTWPNGSRARIFGAHTDEDVQRLRAGGNSAIDWYEELCAWRQLDGAWDQAAFGLRLGEHPLRIITTTPRPLKRIKKLVGDPDCAVTRATTDQNPHLSQAVRDALEEAYGGTRLGRQELGGEIIEDVEGALWTIALIDAGRVDQAPELARIVVAVDPSGGDADGNDEQGIVVVGKGADGEAYVLEDMSCKESPHGWGSRVVSAFHRWKADSVVAEGNFGGQMVQSNIQTIDPNVKVKLVTASRGKQQRAEPIAAFYGDPSQPETWEKGRVHHVGAFGKLEDQMTQWVPGNGKSPDRMDGLVWGLTELMLAHKSPVLLGSW